ncbi:uncharacterized protein TNCV_1447211 [Trichonephila clavipes]|nr:uncharacterized protein TNCV_1447211 [Trichonephila clavipes]
MSWRVTGRLESGQTQRSVGDAVGVARSVVARLWNRFQETGNVRRRPGADESRFSLECDNQRVLVWRDRGTRNNPAFVRERSQYRRAGWMVWGVISIGGRTDLHIIRNDTLTGRRYADLMSSLMLEPLEIPLFSRMIMPTA